MNQDAYDLFDEFLMSDFVDNVITHRIRETILGLRLSIDALEFRNRTQGGLPKFLRDDLEDHWADLDSMTRTYIYFSGDYQMEHIPEWTHKDVPQDTPGWDYWNQGDIK